MPSDRHIDTVVLDAAKASVVAVGWRRTTLTEVARRAGVSRMTLYRRWPDMDGLLADLMTREWTALLPPPTLGDEPVPRTLAACAVSLVRALRRDPLFARLVDVDPDLLLPYLLERRGRSQQHLLDVIVPLLRAGQRRGEVRRGNPEAIARALLLAGHGFAISARTMVDARVGPKALDRELTTLVTRLLAP